MVGAPHGESCRSLAGESIDFVDVIERVKAAGGYCGEGALYRRGYIEKADLAAEKCVHRRLVGGVEDRCGTAAGRQRLASQSQRREAAVVGRLESQLPDRGEIEP